jgi:hypothetical protein
MLNVTAAAEAIEDAYNSSPPCNDHVLDHKQCLAATLRELAKQLGYDNYHVDGDHGLAVVNVRDILHVADELEGVKYGTYRSPWPRQ